MTIDRKRLKTDPGYWDGAGVPEGATHYFHPSGVWYKKTEDMVFAWWSVTGTWQEAASPERLNSEYIIPRPTPKTASEEWVDGLPSIGQRVEVQDPNDETWSDAGVVTEIKTVICTTAFKPGFNATCNFRPFRTKQERQRDELEELMEAEKENCFPHALTAQMVAEAILSRYNLEPKP